MNVRFTSVSFARKVPDACSSFSLQLIKGERYGSQCINMALQHAIEHIFSPFILEET